MCHGTGWLYQDIGTCIGIHYFVCMKRLLKGLEDIHSEKTRALREAIDSCDTDVSSLSDLLASSVRALTTESFSEGERDEILKQVGL